MAYQVCTGCGVDKRDCVCVPSRSWFVLSNENGTVLATYGSALRSMAVDKGHEIKRDCGARVALHWITGARPSVGGSISMKGQITWL